MLCDGVYGNKRKGKVGGNLDRLEGKKKRWVQNRMMVWDSDYNVIFWSKTSIPNFHN